MTAEQLERLMVSNHAPLVVDVRSRAEYDSGHIPGALHAPLTAINTVLQTLSGINAESPLVLVCEHGPRAQLGRFFLKMRGYRNLELLTGHMAHWRSTGRQLQTGT